MTRRGALVGLVGLAVTLAGCLPTPPAATSGPELISARRAAGIADCPASDARVPALAQGLPEVIVTCLGGGAEVRLAGLRGRPMIVNVWAQWCPPCRAESPRLRALADRLGDRVMFLGIDYNDPDPDLAIEFAHVAGWRWAQLTDPDKSLAGPLQLAGIPVTLLVAADGRIARRIVGGVPSVEEMVEMVRTDLGVTP